MRQAHAYCAIKECHAKYGYPIEMACKILCAARSAYHKWAAGKLSHRAAENEALANIIEQIHTENSDKGYRRINDDLRHDHGIYINDKRVLRICRVRDIKSTIKYSNHGCTRQAKNPQYKTLIQMVERYIHYYNTKRVQRNLGVLTPMEKHNLYLAA